MAAPHKLILFDIDGTLIRARDRAASTEAWKNRLKAGIREAFGKEVQREIHLDDFNGMIDVSVFRILAQELGVSEKEFRLHLPKAQQAFHRELKHALAQNRIAYQSIDAARQLAEILADGAKYFHGLLTGNTEENSWLKLTSAGLRDLFSFGVFGDTAEDRNALAQGAISKAQAYFQTAFMPSDVFIIGDTVHDIHAAKHAGVRSIGVATGVTGRRAELAQAGADLAVETLMDKQVLQLLGLAV